MLSLLLVVGSGFAIGSVLYFEDRFVKLATGGNAGESGLPDVEPECVRRACNYLILGSDSRQGLSEKEQVYLGNSTDAGGQRADTIIVVHVDPVKRRTVVLHIPRDLRVEIPGHGWGKINSAFEYGPNTMVRAVERFTRLSINHYVQVNFAGFKKIVDSMGGVPICIDRPMYDKLAGLNLPRAGCYKNLNGRQALAFVRARHVEGDRIPDFSRISRQQQFMRVVIQKLLSARAVLGINGLVRAVQENLVIDEHLNLYSLQDLTRKLSGVGHAGVAFRVVPAIPTFREGVAYVEAVEPDTSKLLYRIRTGKPLGKVGKEEPNTPISPANVTVRVYDANAGGRAQEVASYLQRAGFVVVATEPAPAGLVQSRIMYAEDSADQQAVVSSYLPDIPALADETHTAGADVTVVIGPDYSGTAF